MSLLCRPTPPAPRLFPVCPSASRPSGSRPERRPEQATGCFRTSSRSLSPLPGRLPPSEAPCSPAEIVPTLCSALRPAPVPRLHQRSLLLSPTSRGSEGISGFVAATPLRGLGDGTRLCGAPCRLWSWADVRPAPASKAYAHSGSRAVCLSVISHGSLRSTRHIVGAALEVGKFKVELHVPKTPVMTERSRKAYRGLTFGLKALKCCFPHGTHRIWHIVDA